MSKGALPQFEGIQEVDGKLVKIVSTRIDGFTIKRTAMPVTETELAKIRAAVQGKAEKEAALLEKHTVEEKALTPEESADQRILKKRKKIRTLEEEDLAEIA